MAALLGADLDNGAGGRATRRRRARSARSPTTMIPRQVVISGHRGAVERALEIAKEKGAKRAILLPVSAPFHCPLMQPAADAMARGAGRRRRSTPPAVPLYANVTAAPVDRSRRDPRPAGRAGHRPGPLARERRRRWPTPASPISSSSAARCWARWSSASRRSERDQRDVSMDDIDALVREICRLFTRRRGDAEKTDGDRRLTGDVVDALRIHRDLGPGLLEIVYERSCRPSFGNRGLKVDRQRPVDIKFEGIGFRRIPDRSHGRGSLGG